jgi:hypothetical protein
MYYSRISEIIIVIIGTTIFLILKMYTPPLPPGFLELLNHMWILNAMAHFKPRVPYMYNVDIYPCIETSPIDTFLGERF